MRRRLLIGTLLLSAFLFAGGAYITTSIDNTTRRLTNLVLLHQAANSRETMVLLAERAVRFLQIHETPDARPWPEVLDNAVRLVAAARSCSECHEEIPLGAAVDQGPGGVVALTGAAEAFRAELEDYIHIPPTQPEHAVREERLIHNAELLAGWAAKMQDRAMRNLEDGTEESLARIARHKTLLHLLLAVGPLALSLAAFLYMRGFTRPVEMLLESTRHIREGDWTHRVRGLSGEYQDLGEAFNEMAGSLQDHLQRLESSEKRYRTLFETAGDAIFLVDAEGPDPGRIVSANPAAAELHGYAAGELEGMHIVRDLDTEDSAQEAPGRIDRLLAGERLTFEVSHRRKDGSVFPVEVMAGVVELEGHRYLLAIDRDISEREAAERELRLFQAAVAGAMDGIQLVDLDGRIRYSNPAVEALYGFSTEELAGRHVSEMNADPEFAATVIMPSLREQGHWSGELWVRAKDGRQFPIRLNAAVIRDAQGKPLSMVGVIRDDTEHKRMEAALRRAKDEWEDTFNTLTDLITIHDAASNDIVQANRSARALLDRLPLTALNTLCLDAREGLAPDAVEEIPFYSEELNRYFEIRCIPRSDAAGAVFGYVRVMRDVTEKKRAEAALHRAEQLRTVGDLAASLAHEIKNPLAGIKVSMDLLAEEDYLKQEDRELVTGVADEIMRVEVLMRSLLDYARPPKPKAEALDVCRALDDTLDALKRYRAFAVEGAAPMEIQREYGAGLPPARADRAQLRQVLLNLFLNAREAMPEGGAVTVGARLLPEEGQLELRIADSGRGIGPQALERIFEPFFTTRAAGSGLGLAVCKQLLEQQGGSIRAHNDPAGGAVFTITLPVAAELE